MNVQSIREIYLPLLILEMNSCSRLHGSYEALKYGTVLDGIADFTGGISESIPIKNDSNNNILGTLDGLLRMTTIVTCKVTLSSEVYKSFLGTKHL